MKVDIPDEVMDAVQAGPVTELVDAGEHMPDGSTRVALRKPTWHWERNERKAKAEQKRLVDSGWYTPEQAYMQAHVIPNEGETDTAYPVPQEMVDRMKANLPAEIRREARERFRVLVSRLFADAQTQFYKDGVVRWPASIERELAIIGAAQGKPNITDQVEALARRFIVKGAREQQAHDRKQIARSWHGHLSA